jgi:hypothetical protein
LPSSRWPAFSHTATFGVSRANRLARPKSGQTSGSEDFSFTTLEDVLFAATRDINRRLDGDEPVEAPKGEKGMFAPWYAGSDIGLYSRGVAGGAIRYQMKGTSLEKAFAEAARINWLTTYTAARGIKDRSLRGKAILGTCRAVLLPR